MSDKGLKEEYREEYEEAMFRILMKGVADAEGERLLTENERLESDPGFRVPEEIDRSVNRAIRRVFARQRTRKMFRKVGSAAAKAAVVFLVAGTLFTGVYAVFPEVRNSVRNLVFDVTDEYTSMTFSEDSIALPVAPVESSETLMGYSLPKMPDGFEVVEMSENKNSGKIQYQNEFGNFIFIRISYGNNLNVDTENTSRAKNVNIGDKEGLLIIKGQQTQLSFADAESGAFISIQSDNIDWNDIVSFAAQIQLVSQ